jgi:hypothetical protein
VLLVFAALLLIRNSGQSSCLAQIVVYQSKDGAATEVLDALEWLAAMCSPVPGEGEQIVRYYGYYSNDSRGKREKQSHDGLIPCILEADESKKRRQKN